MLQTDARSVQLVIALGWAPSALKRIAAGSVP
jgi:hypothetical protein